MYSTHKVSNLYHKNKFKNIRLNQMFSNRFEKKRNTIYKIYFNIKEIKQLKLKNLKYIIFYLYDDIKEYKKEYFKILFDDFRSGVSVINFCNYYDIETNDLIKIITKKFLNINDYYILLKFSQSKEVEKYFNIIDEYRKEKERIDVKNIFLRQNREKTKQIIFKKKYKGKNITLTTNKKIKNFDDIKHTKKMKILSI